jgi:hypothetical protein
MGERESVADDKFIVMMKLFLANGEENENN